MRLADSLFILELEFLWKVIKMARYLFISQSIYINRSVPLVAHEWVGGMAIKPATDESQLAEKFRYFEYWYAPQML